jgi:hypothetical protein
VALLPLIFATGKKYGSEIISIMSIEMPEICQLALFTCAHILTMNAFQGGKLKTLQKKCIDFFLKKTFAFERFDNGSGPHIA